MHAILLHLIIFTGIRNGEVVGLKWDDIDFATKTVYIQRERLYVSTVGIVTDTPKTESSIRKISVPTFIMQMLSDLKTEQSDRKEKSSTQEQSINGSSTFRLSTGLKRRQSTTSGILTQQFYRPWEPKLLVYPKDLGIPIPALRKKSTSIYLMTLTIQFHMNLTAITKM